jgi:hypothetical protein
MASGIVARARHQCKWRSQVGVELFVAGTQLPVVDPSAASAGEAACVGGANPAGSGPTG